MAETREQLRNPQLRSLLDEAQAGFPLAQRPFSVLGHAVGWTEDTVLNRLLDMKNIGVLVRIGPVLDTANLGWTSTLIAAKIKDGKLSRVAEDISRWEEVTHCYARQGPYNLWFTLTRSIPKELENRIAECRTLEGIEEILDLRTVVKYKADTRMPLSRVAFDSGLSRVTLDRPSSQDLRLLFTLSEGLELVVEPYRRPCEELGVTLSELFQGVHRCVSIGLVRRVCALLSHRALGFKHNVLCVKPCQLCEAETLAAELMHHPKISHIYLRKETLHESHMFCAMIHSESMDHFLQLRETIPCLNEFQSFLTTRCYKRSPFRGQEG